MSDEFDWRRLRALVFIFLVLGELVVSLSEWEYFRAGVDRES